MHLKTRRAHPAHHRVASSVRSFTTCIVLGSTRITFDRADVSMLEFVQADGELVCYTRDDDPDLLEGCRVHLGALGVVSRLTLDVVEYFEVEARTYIDVPLEPLIDSLPDLWRGCDSLSVWTGGFGTGPGQGTAWVTMRHFDPHWDPSLSVPASGAGVDEAVLGSSGKLMEDDVPRYCSEEGDRFTPTRRGPWHSALTLTLDDAYRETPMGIVDIRARPTPPALVLSSLSLSLSLPLSLLLLSLPLQPRRGGSPDVSSTHDSRFHFSRRGGVLRAPGARAACDACRVGGCTGMVLLVTLGAPGEPASQGPGRRDGVSSGQGRQGMALSTAGRFARHPHQLQCGPGVP